jgi:hypothetical protein
MNTVLRLVVASAVTLLYATSAYADHHCANLPGLKLTVKKYHLELNDKRPICVTVPGEFKITIHNPPGSGVSVGSEDVSVRQKDDSDEPDVKIFGDNKSPTNKVAVSVEGAAGDGDEFEFWIIVKGVGKLDPKVKVIDSDALMNQQYRAVGDAMDAFGLTFEDAFKIRLPPDAE